MNTVPYAEEFERALIVGLLSDPSLIPRVTAIVGEKDFFKENHKEIFKVITDLDVDTVDSLTVEDKLSSKTREYFQDLVKNSDSIIPSLANVLVYAETIKNKSKLRSGIDLGRDIISLCYNGDVDATEVMHNLEDMFANFLQRRVVEDKDVSTKEAFKEFIFTRGEVQTEPLVTGFEGIDSIVRRLEGLIILAGRPSTGKTALAINIARNVAEIKPVVFFSLEQGRDQVFERMLAAEAEVNSEEIRSCAYLQDAGLSQRIEKATERLIPILDKIHIDDRPSVDSAYITSVARQKKFEWGDVGLVIVDYLHIMKLNEAGGKVNKVDALGDATKNLRALGRELECPVLLLSQLSRQPDQYGDQNGKRHRRPELTDLRSSGEIEQSADIVMFLYRESYYDTLVQSHNEDIVEVIVRKNRNGRIGIGTLGWIPRFLKFKDLD